MLKNKHVRQYFAAIALSLVCLMSIMPSAGGLASLQSVAQSYTSNTPLQDGIIVQFSNQKGSIVEPATLSVASRIQGVVVAANDADVTLSTTAASGQPVFVASSGRYNVLVSDQNGPITAGSYITISSLNGIGMLADANESEVVGRAQNSFDGVHNVVGSATLRNQSNHQVSVTIGSIAVDIAISTNPLQPKGISQLPAMLQTAAQFVTNKAVSIWRIYLAVAVLIAALVASVVLLYSGVKGGMTAIGRNPLAKQSIARNMIQVVLTSVIIFIIGLFGVYLLLKL